MSALGNRNESPLRRDALPMLTRIARAVGMNLRGSIVSLDGVYDCRRNRKAIFNRGMIPNINPNSCGRQSPKRGRKALFDPAIFQERFNAIERVFGWDDKFRCLLLRSEQISQLHEALGTTFVDRLGANGPGARKVIIWDKGGHFEAVATKQSR